MSKVGKWFWKKQHHLDKLAEMGVNDIDLRNYIQDWIRQDVEKLQNEITRRRNEL